MKHNKLKLRDRLVNIYRSVLDSIQIDISNQQSCF